MKTIRLALRLGELIFRYYLLPKKSKIKFFAQTGGYQKRNKHIPLITEYVYHTILYGVIIYLILPEHNHIIVIPTIIGSAISFTLFTMVGKLARYLKQQ